MPVRTRHTFEKPHQQKKTQLLKRLQRAQENTGAAHGRVKHELRSAQHALPKRQEQRTLKIN
eukprot:1772965-Alexandrium_andersonii.AAC.1